VATTTNDDELLATAFRHPDGRLVAVVMNETDADKEFALWVDGRAAKAKSPAHSILTLTW
jgi:glucosylceramidase